MNIKARALLCAALLLAVVNMPHAGQAAAKPEAAATFDAFLIEKLIGA